MDSSLARLDGFTDAMRDRLAAAAQDAPESEMGAFREASASLESGLSRLRAGLADGSLAPADIQRGVGNAFQGAREILDAGRPEVAEQGAESANMGERVRSRFEGFTESVMARIESADMPDDQRAVVAEATSEAFESAAARLDKALFDATSGDSIDRGTYMNLFSSSLGALQEQLGQLLAPMESGSNARTYSAQSSLEGLMPRSGRIDVAG